MAASRRRNATPTSRRRAPRLGLGWILAGLLAVLALAGCGDNPAPREAATSTAPAPREKKATAPKPTPGEPLSSDDRAQIVAVIETMESAINDQDAKRLCTDVYAFQGGTTTKQCVDALGPALTQSKPQVSITVRSVKREGSRAIVTANSEGPGASGSGRRTYTLVQKDGRWRALYE